MPKYQYNCADCDNKFVAFHSIKEKLQDCPVCGLVDSLVRVPGTFVSDTGRTEQEQAGSLVKEKIEELREDLKSQRRDIARGHHE
jgi:putative FmdB family regulatory protein